MHSAWRAYHAFTELYGPDPSLPDDAFQYFTSDQLFFLAFAQVHKTLNSHHRSRIIKILYLIKDRLRFVHNRRTIYQL